MLLIMMMVYGSYVGNGESEEGDDENERDKEHDDEVGDKSCISVDGNDHPFILLSLPLSGPVTDKTPYEIVRSQELNTLLGPKGSPEAMDLVCDLHNTTANMGLCLIAYSDCDWISLHIYRYLQARENNPHRDSLFWMHFLIRVDLR